MLISYDVFQEQVVENPVIPEVQEVQPAVVDDVVVEYQKTHNTCISIRCYGVSSFNEISGNFEVFRGCEDSEGYHREDDMLSFSSISFLEEC